MELDSDNAAPSCTPIEEGVSAHSHPVDASASTVASTAVASSTITASSTTTATPPTPLTSSAFQELIAPSTLALREHAGSMVGDVAQLVRATVKASAVHETLANSAKSMVQLDATLQSTARTVDRLRRNVYAMHERTLAMADDLGQVPALYDLIKLEHLTTVPPPVYQGVGVHGVSVDGTSSSKTVVESP